MGAEQVDARVENALKNIHFIDENRELIARFQEVVHIPIPDRGETVSISEGQGYYDPESEELEFDTQPTGRFLVKDIEYEYTYLTYPTEDEETVIDRLFCYVYITVEAIE